MIKIAGFKWVGGELYARLRFTHNYTLPPWTATHVDYSAWAALKRKKK